MGRGDKAVSWRWSELSLLDEKKKAYCLTEQQAAFFAAATRQAEWRTRWDSAALSDWDNVQSFIASTNHALMEPCVTGSEEGQTCVEYLATDRFINYLPAEPDSIPPNYAIQPFTIFRPNLSIFDEFLNRYGLDLSGFVGFEPGDVITTLIQYPSPEYTGLNPIGWINQWIQHILSVVTNGLPRFSFTVEGSGVIEIHFVHMPFGGYALIGVDLNQNIVDLALDLISGSIGISEINHLIELGRDVFSIPPERGGEVIHEIKIDEEGVHTVDCVFLPRFNDSVSDFVGFGGGLRSIVLCGFDPVYTGGGVDVAQIEARLTADCVLQFQVRDDSGNITQPYTDVVGWPSGGPLCLKGEPGPPGPPGQNGSSVTIGSGGRILIDNNGDGVPDEVYEPPSSQPNDVPNTAGGYDTDQTCNAADYIAGRVINHATKTINDAANLTFAEYVSESFASGGFISGGLKSLWDYAVANLTDLAGVDLSAYKLNLTEGLYCEGLNRSAVTLDSVPEPEKSAIIGALNSFTDGQFWQFAYIGKDISSAVDCLTFGCNEFEVFLVGDTPETPADERPFIPAGTYTLQITGSFETWPTRDPLPFRHDGLYFYDSAGSNGLDPLPMKTGVDTTVPYPSPLPACNFGSGYTITGVSWPGGSIRLENVDTSLFDNEKTKVTYTFTPE
jgi:hypothetical protein